MDVEDRHPEGRVGEVANGGQMGLCAGILRLVKSSEKYAAASCMNVRVSDGREEVLQAKKPVLELLDSPRLERQEDDRFQASDVVEQAGTSRCE
jgi:hypothetical protein